MSLMESSEPRAHHIRLENAVSITVLAVMALLPLVEILGRLLVGRGISGSIVIVQNLTLWITLLGAACLLYTSDAADE